MVNLSMSFNLKMSIKYYLISNLTYYICILKFYERRLYMGLSKYEQETCITYNCLEKEVKIWTANPFDIRRLDKLCINSPKNYRLVSQDSVSKTYICNSKKLIKFSKPREYTEEVQEKMKELAKLRFKRK